MTDFFVVLGFSIVWLLACSAIAFCFIEFAFWYARKRRERDE